MKNIAEFKKAPELAEKLLEVFSNLKGNSRSLDPMRAGQHDVVLIESTEKLSAKGKEMKVIKLRSLEDGRDITGYVMKFRKQDWNKWVNIEVGDRLKIDVTFSNGFASIKPLTVISKGNEKPFKPSEALTKQTILLFDIEVFKHDTLFVFRDYFTKEWFIINNDLNALRSFYLEYRDSMFIGYNNASYDNNVMRGYLQGKNAYQISKTIIESDDRGLVYKMFDSHKTPLLGMDLYQDNKGFSLKEHSAFLGINIKETEVDFDMDRPLTDEEKAKNIAYCKNDVLATEKRFEQNISMLLAKAVLALSYDLNKTDLLKTNANLTATILGAVRHNDRGDERSYYELPEGFSIENQDVLDNLTGELPDKIEVTLQRRDVELVLGEGGSHSAKTSFIDVSGNMYHSDATSLHPSSMRLFDLESRNIPEEFKGRYQEIIEKRVNAKHNKNNIVNIKGVDIPGWVLDLGLKLPLNGTYGAMGAEFNPLYDPRQRLRVCLVGQLAFMDLLEKVEPHATVVQTNTDAIDYIPFSEIDREELNNIFSDWEERTGYELDTERYVEMFQANVNNYVQRMDDGSVNIKGAIGLTKGLKNSKAVVSNAFINYLLAGKDYKEYINECTDIRQFQIISKTGYTFDQTIQRDIHGNEINAQKVNRVFAVKDKTNAVELFKVKKTHVLDSETDEMIDSLSYTKGLANAPEHYTISNEAIGEGITINEIDKDYYIRQVEDTLELWFGENYKERVEQARAEGDKRHGKLEVREYIKD